MDTFPRRRCGGRRRGRSPGAIGSARRPARSPHRRAVSLSRCDGWSGKQPRNIAGLGSAHGRPVRRLRRGRDAARGAPRRGTRCSPTDAADSARARVVQGDPRRARPDDAGRAARPHRGARQLLPRAGRHLRLRRRGAPVPARRRAARHRRRPSGSIVEAGIKQRVRALEAFLADVYGAQQRGARRRHPGAAHQLVEPLPPRGGRHRQPANGVRIQVSRHRPHPRRARAPGGCSKTTCGCRRGVSYVISNRRVMAQTLPELFVSMRVRPVGDYPQQAAAGAARLRPRRRRRPERRRAHPRRLQLRLLRAHAARAPDGRRARRGPRPVLLRRPGVDAHDRRPDARRRDLPPRRRRVPRPAAVPRRLDARLARASCSPRASAT